MIRTMPAVTPLSVFIALSNFFIACCIAKR